MKTKGTVRQGGEGLVVRSQGGGCLYNHSGVVHCTCHYRPAEDLFHGDVKLRLAFSPQ